MRLLIAAGLGALALACALPGAAAASARTCPRHEVHAVISGKQACLARGASCIAADNRQYRRYGFVCEPMFGYYRLEPKG